MNPSEKFNLENPLVKYNQILEELRSEGKELDEKFAEQIQWNRDQCFESMEVSSPEELNRELSPETGASAKFPVGFDFDVDFAGYHCEIGG